MPRILVSAICALLTTLPMAAQERKATITVTTPAVATSPASRLDAAMTSLEAELVAKYGEASRERLRRGMQQAARLWLPEDGSPEEFADFVRTNFAGDQATLDLTFKRLEYGFEQINGHMLEITRELRMVSDLDREPILPVDDILGAWDASAHTNDDFFQNKLAFLVLLNFPMTTLNQRLTEGESWSRRQWAEARLAQRFSRRVPASVVQEYSKASAAASKYIADYNIWMHHVLTDKGERLFPAKMRLLSHWNLRDQIKADYSDPKGLPKQQLIQKVMERIVTQTIPAAVLDNPAVDWKPFANEVSAAASAQNEKPAAQNPSNAPEPNTRYAVLLQNFRAQQKIDPYSPTAPTLIDRKYDEEREIPEERVKAMFEKVLTSPLVPRVAKLIEKRLGRKLQPFDIWYNGFRPRGRYSEAELDAITQKKYPSPEAFEKDIPNILAGLGFDPARAKYVAEKIEVHPARGSGHAWGAGRRGDKAYLRTRVEAEGMNYKGYNIAVHELGHNVEQTFSLYDIDHTLLSGVPNNAFTEALAFVFQKRDLELLGLSKPDAESTALATLNDFWGTFEIAGVGLVDTAVWHWMYDHPNATPEQLRDAVVQISKDVWNRYYAPVFGQRDVLLLGIYSHMINRELYLPDYPIGHMIAFQIDEQIDRTGKLGAEFERMSRIGTLAPDVWMKQATGAPVGPEALLAATERALTVVK